MGISISELNTCIPTGVLLALSRCQFIIVACRIAIMLTILGYGEQVGSEHRLRRRIAKFYEFGTHIDQLSAVMVVLWCRLIDAFVPFGILRLANG